MKTCIETIGIKILDETSGEYVHLGEIYTPNNNKWEGEFKFKYIDESKLNSSLVRNLMIECQEYTYYVNYHISGANKESYTCSPVDSGFKEVNKNTGEVKLYGDWKE